jgi:hypothetical protein
MSGARDVFGFDLSSEALIAIKNDPLLCFADDDEFHLFVGQLVLSWPHIAKHFKEPVK